MRLFLTLAIAFCAAAAFGATSPLQTAEDYDWTKVAHTNIIKGRVMGKGADYKILRGEDIAYLWEATTEREGFGNGTGPLPKAQRQSKDSFALKAVGWALPTNRWLNAEETLNSGAWKATTNYFPHSLAKDGHFDGIFKTNETARFDLKANFAPKIAAVTNCYAVMERYARVGWMGDAHATWRQSVEKSQNHTEWIEWDFFIEPPIIVKYDNNYSLEYTNNYATVHYYADAEASAIRAWHWDIYDDEYKEAGGSPITLNNHSRSWRDPDGVSNIVVVAGLSEAACTAGVDRVVSAKAYFTVYASFTRQYKEERQGLGYTKEEDTTTNAYAIVECTATLAGTNAPIEMATGTVWTVWTVSETPQSIINRGIAAVGFTKPTNFPVDMPPNPGEYEEPEEWEEDLYTENRNFGHEELTAGISMGSTYLLIQCRMKTKLD